MPKIKGKNIDKPVDGYVSGRNYALQELSNFGNFYTVYVGVLEMFSSAPRLGEKNLITCKCLLHCIEYY